MRMPLSVSDVRGKHAERRMMIDVFNAFNDVKREFYKSLDREVDIFGLKGRWITVFLAMAVASVIAGALLGTVFGGVVSTIACIGLVVGCYFVCVTIEAVVPPREMPKLRAASRMPSGVSPKETLSRIYIRPPYRRPDWLVRAIASGYADGSLVSLEEDLMRRRMEGGGRDLPERKIVSHE